MISFIGYQHQSVQPFKMMYQNWKLKNTEFFTSITLFNSFEKGMHESRTNYLEYI